jgi:hypothetical protein
MKHVTPFTGDNPHVSATKIGDSVMKLGDLANGCSSTMDNPHKVSPVTHEPPLADAVPGDQFPKPCNDEEHLDLHDESEETFMDQAQWHHSSPASQQLTFCGHPIHLPQAPQFFQHQANATINGGTSGAGCSGSGGSHDDNVSRGYVNAN